MSNSEKIENNNNIFNFGYTTKRQFLVYLTNNVSIENNKIVFKDRDVFTGNDMYNFYEHFPDSFHIFFEFRDIIKNGVIKDNDVCNFIKKYGYLFYDRDIIEVAQYDSFKDFLNPVFKECSVNKKDFIDELYIFYNITELYFLISRYKELQNTTIKGFKHWNTNKNRIYKYLKERYNYTKDRMNKEFIDLSCSFILNEKALEKIKDCFSILLNYHLENMRVQVLEYNSEFISSLSPKSLIEVIYLDYFNYITEKGKNKKVRVCKECGNTFYIDFSKNGDKKIFCSTKCKDLYHSNSSNGKIENRIKNKYYKKLYNSEFSHNTDYFLNEANIIVEQYRLNKGKMTITEYENEIIKIYNKYLAD